MYLNSHKLGYIDKIGNLGTQQLNVLSALIKFTMTPIQV